MNPASPDAITAMLRSGRFATPTDLARALADAMQGYFKHQTSTRGLKNDEMVDSDGGTKLSVTDQSAARQSISLQPRQLLRSRQIGATAMRFQKRADILTRTVPAMVVAINGTAPDVQITVKLVGDTPKVYTDSTTRQLQSGSPLGDLSLQSDQMAETNSTEKTLTLTGIAFAAETEAGPKVPVAGQTVMVTLSQQNTKRTAFVERNRENLPRVINYPGTEEAVMINGLCCQEAGGGGPGGT